jgi:hypothetical protein
MKNMLFKDVPSGGSSKVLMCMGVGCGRGSAIKDILSHNSIWSFSEGQYEVYKIN